MNEVNEVNEVIENYAHDYRNMTMSEEELTEMLRSFFLSGLDVFHDKIKKAVK